MKSFAVYQTGVLPIKNSEYLNISDELTQAIISQGANVLTTGLSKLNSKQRSELEKEITGACGKKPVSVFGINKKKKEEWEACRSKYVADIQAQKSAQTQALLEQQTGASKRTLYWVLGGLGAVVLIVVGVIVIKKMKK